MEWKDDTLIKHTTSADVPVANFISVPVKDIIYDNASLLIGAGIDVATVSGTLGHSNQTTTLSVYSHMFQEYQVKACDAVANALKFNSAS